MSAHIKHRARGQRRRSRQLEEAHAIGEAFRVVCAGLQPKASET